MKFGILGAGNTGKAYSALLSALGQEVILYDRNPARLAPLQDGIQASGAVEGRYQILVTADPAQAADSDVLLVCTTADGHRPLAAGLRGLLRPGQSILVTNCCWGAVEFDQELGAEAEEKGCPIGETSGQLILCNSPAPGAVYLKTIKQHISLACVRTADTKRLLSRLAPLFPQFSPASSVLETSLNNTNPVAHGPLALFNLTRLDTGEGLLLFGTGATHGVTRAMEAIDRERVAVAQACGVPAASQLELLNSFWPESRSSLYEVFHRTPAYGVTKGPKSLQHRYFTEDLPYGLVPCVRLGKKLDVPTPRLEALITVLGLYLGEDYIRQGPELERLDLSRYQAPAGA